jgi:AGCS family alanine or glycine:cation symporter
VAGQYSDRNPENVAELFAHLDFLPPENDPVKPFTGEVRVTDGVLQPGPYTVIHNRSVAEDVRASRDGTPFTGTIAFDGGAPTDPAVVFSGRSLLHSVPLTAKAFEQSFLGPYGQYAVTVGLVLFAFSTALAWSYYGDRAVTYLFGLRWVTLYRVLYVLGFFSATIADTSLVWLISAVTLALMALPNLLGIMLMRKEMKSLTRDYWAKIKQRPG